MERREVAEKKDLTRKMFRRNSLTDHGKEVIDRRHMLTIFDRMGQHVNERELDHFIDMVDTEHSGMLDYDGFTKVCDKFLTNAAALEKAKGDEFAFKHLITLSDFENP